MTILALLRHGDLDKSKKDDSSKRVDETYDWSISHQGILQSKEIGRYLKSQHFFDGVPPKKTDVIVGDQLRLRETMFHVLDVQEEFGDSVRVYREQYLNGRLRGKGFTQNSDPLLGKTAITEENFLEYLERGPVRFLGRLGRRAKDYDQYFAVTTREFIVGTRFRLRGCPTSEMHSVLTSLSHDGHDIRNNYDVATGELVMFADIHPETGEGERTKLRWEKVVNPFQPQRSTSWKPCCVRTYTKEELLKEELWNPPHAGEDETS